MSESVKLTGRVKMWDPRRGYGFLATGVGDVLVPASALSRDRWGGLPYGAEATAEVVLGDGGKWRATRVLVIALVQ